MKSAAIAIVLTLIAALCGTWLTDRWHTSAVQAAYQAGKEGQAGACVQQVQARVAEAEARVREQAKQEIAAAASAAQEHQAVRTVIETRFIKLREEAAHAPVDDVDRCVLPPERLRRWSEANSDPTGAAAAGADPGAPAGEPAAASAPLAPAQVGGDPRSGTEPPAGGRGLPPAGGADVRPAQAPDGLAARSMRPLDARPFPRA